MYFAEHINQMDEAVIDVRWPTKINWKDSLGTVYSYLSSTDTPCMAADEDGFLKCKTKEGWIRYGGYQPFCTASAAAHTFVKYRIKELMLQLFLYLICLTSIFLYMFFNTEHLLNFVNMLIYSWRVYYHLYGSPWRQTLTVRKGGQIWATLDECSIILNVMPSANT